MPASLAMELDLDFEDDDRMALTKLSVSIAKRRLGSHRCTSHWTALLDFDIPAGVSRGLS